VTEDIDRSDELLDWYAEDDPDGAEVLDRLEDWFGRFIAVTDPDDLLILALWTVHTHLARELYTTARLTIDSTIPGSGKTTVLDHLNRLCKHPVQAALLSSAALLPRLLENGMRTILLDEVDRSLRPDKPGVEDLLAVLNSGYRFGATRPVLLPVKGGGWESSDMSTFAPVAMAGNSPHLPPDTVSRCIRILLMPDLDGTVEDSDWESIDDHAEALRQSVARFADAVRDQVRGMVVDLPHGCISRSKEKWRPLKRVAVAAGGRWPAIADRLIVKSLAEDAAEREAGLRTLPPGMVLLTDLHTVWSEGESFMATRDLVAKLILHNPDFWGSASPYGKPLTETRFGRMLAQASKLTSSRPGGAGPRGYLRSQLEPVWHRLGIGRRFQPGEPGEPGEPGGKTPLPAETGNHQVHRVDSEPGEPDCASENDSTSGNHQVNRLHRVDRVERGIIPQPGGDQTGVDANGAYLNGLCRNCGVNPHSPGRTRCEECHKDWQTSVDRFDR